MGILDCVRIANSASVLSMIAVRYLVWYSFCLYCNYQGLASIFETLIVYNAAGSIYKKITRPDRAG